jgi:thiosulfate dehydrogenase
MRRLLAIPLLLTACQPQERQASATDVLSRDAREAEIRHGRDLVSATRQHLPRHVGNSLSCTSCHLEAGRRPKAAPFAGVPLDFPQYRARSGRVDTLEDRINDCFRRSLNGKPLAKDSRDMRAMIAYMTWLSKGIPAGKQAEGRGIPRIAPKRPADPEAGKRLYAASCASCHGQDGAGMGGYPPLWGPRSFTIGAGMARMHTLAAFIRWNMPLGDGGSLSPEEAYDLAAYVLSHERPDYAAKHLDWPRGGKPEDAPY